MILLPAENSTNSPSAFHRPRLGFVGVGWIGRKRLEAIAHSGLADIVAVFDCDADKAVAAQKFAPTARLSRSYEELLEMDLDGLVIATPNAFHAAQTLAALERGLAVFCQKPLAPGAEETRRIVETAQACNRLLGVDLSYRFLTGIQKIRELLRGQSCGKIFAAQLAFHNAYGPDKPWFYDFKLAGGGCLLDLGIHLVDLALWCLDFPQIITVNSRLFARGQLLTAPLCQLEDFASAQLALDNGASLEISCSWNLHAGCDALISGSFYGTQGGAEFRNVNGSFTEFAASHFQGTKCESLALPPDDWQGRAAVQWVRQLAQNPCFDSAAQSLVRVAETLDQIYGR